jgi:hypothetical protein
MRGGERCPLSTFVPLRSSAARVTVEVPQALPALEVGKPEAEAREGKVVLRWQPVGVPGVTTYDVFGRLSGQQSGPAKLTREPLRVAVFSDATFHGGREASYAVVARAPRRAEPVLPAADAWVSAVALPLPKEPVFVLKPAAEGLALHAGAPGRPMCLRRAGSGARR